MTTPYSMKLSKLDPYLFEGGRAGFLRDFIENPIASVKNIGTRLEHGLKSFKKEHELFCYGIMGSAFITAVGAGIDALSYIARASPYDLNPGLYPSLPGYVGAIIIGFLVGANVGMGHQRNMLEEKKPIWATNYRSKDQKSMDEYF